MDASVVDSSLPVVPVTRIRQPERYEAHGGRDGNPLSESVIPRTLYLAHHTGEVRLPVLTQLVEQLLRTDAPRGILGILGPQNLVSLQILERSMYSDRRVRAYLQVQVAVLLLR